MRFGIRYKYFAFQNNYQNPRDKTDALVLLKKRNK